MPAITTIERAIVTMDDGTVHEFGSQKAALEFLELQRLTAEMEPDLPDYNGYRAYDYAKWILEHYHLVPRGMLALDAAQSLVDELASE